MAKSRIVKDDSQISIRLARGLYARVEVAASDCGIDFTTAMDEALMAWLERAGPRAAQRQYDMDYTENLHSYRTMPARHNYPDRRY